jgi:hypothetical protein
MNLRRPRKAVLMVALVVTLALLCCGGSVTLLLWSGLRNDGSDRFINASLACGKGGALDPDSVLPEISPYDAGQIRNAAIIINVGADMALPPRAWVIAVATAMQESGLNNLGDLGDRNDHDSLGLFQQRPSSGWGTPTQVRDPVYASTKFYTKLKTIQGWERMALTRAAQAVQISAYPDAYAKHEPVATQIVNLLANGAANAVGDSVTLQCAVSGAIAASGWTIPLKGPVTRASTSVWTSTGRSTRWPAERCPWSSATRTSAVARPAMWTATRARAAAGGWSRSSMRAT